MSICPFLSSGGYNIKCFKECAFYESEEVEEECPFKKNEYQRAAKSVNYEELKYSQEKTYYYDDNIYNYNI